MALAAKIVVRDENHTEYQRERLTACSDMYYINIVDKKG